MTKPEFANLVELILNYFESSSGEAARAGDPFERDEAEPLLLEFSGVVGVSGQRNGCIYYTSPSELLQELAANLLGTEAATRAAARDMAGEIANMIGGNAQQYLGGDFVISAPIMLEGRPKNIRLPIYDPAYVIPIDWKSHRSYAVFGLRA
ncbi:MAG: chemotaxis protein CheX [bacterium]|nr:chemotaxis protein CheX [bacterium]